MAKKKAEMQQAVPAEETQKKNKKLKDKDSSSEEKCIENEQNADAVVSDETSVSDSPDTSGSTECLSLDDEAEDNSILATMRKGKMSAAEVYRVSQSFFDANLDIASLLLSNEPFLVINTLEILSRNNYWQPEVLQLLDAKNDDIRRNAQGFANSFLGCDRSIADDIVENVIRMSATYKDDDEFQAFLQRVVSAFLYQFGHDEEDPEAWIPAFTRLLSIVDEKRVAQLLYDSSECVRIAVLRFYMTKPTLSVNTLVASLILLRDKSEKVALVLIQLIGQFALYPELSVPALIDYYVRHEDKKQIVFDAIRRFKDDAYQPLISLLDVQSDATASAVEKFMNASPLRYLDALQTTFKTPSLTQHAKKRIEGILKGFIPLVDKQTGLDIIHFFEPPKPPVELVEYPKRRPVDLMDPVLDCSDPFYAQLLDDNALKKYLDIPEADIMRLLNDARVETCINALNLIRVSGHASGAMRMNLVMYIKTSNVEIGKAASLAYDKTFEGDPIELTKTLVSAVGTVESRELAAYYFDIIKGSQTHINNLIALYAAEPARYKPLVIRILRDDPSPETIKGIAKCFSSEVSFPCMVATLQMLTSSTIHFDFSPFRKRLLALIEDPGCRGEYAVTLRKFSLRIIYKLIKDGERDEPTIHVIQGVYKKFIHPELKKLSTDILRKMDVDSFDDLEDNDDDFGDLDD